MRTNRIGWNSGSFDEQVFRLIVLDSATSGETAQAKMKNAMKCVSRACDASMSRKRNSSARRPVYWWNYEIAQIRMQCHRARRQYQRARGRSTFVTLQTDFKNLRSQLKKAIKASKRRCWRDLCSEVDSNPWGRPYKTVMVKLKKPSNAITDLP